jgi:amidase
MNVLAPVTLIGLPCVTVPCGAGPTGFPVGLSIFAKKENDAQLLLLARWYYKHAAIKVTELKVLKTPSISESKSKQVLANKLLIKMIVL